MYDKASIQAYLSGLAISSTIGLRPLPDSPVRRTVRREGLRCPSGGQHPSQQKHP